MISLGGSAVRRGRGARSRDRRFLKSARCAMTRSTAGGGLGV